VALTQIYSQNDLSVSTTELSCTGGTSTIQDRTDAGVVALMLDCSNIAAGDEFEVKFYERTQASGDTRREVWRSSLTTSTGPAFMTPLFPVIHGWDFTIIRIAGSNRTFDISVRGYV
jgi:hypothetical protein